MTFRDVETPGTLRLQQLAAAPGDALQHSPLLAMVMDWPPSSLEGKKMLGFSSITT